VVGSGRVTVFVDQSTEDVDAFDAASRDESGSRRGWHGSWNLEVDAAVGTGGVVVLEEGRQHVVEVAAASRKFDSLGFRFRSPRETPLPLDMNVLLRCDGTPSPTS